MKFDFDLYCNVSNFNVGNSSEYIKELLDVISTAEQYRYKGALFHFNHLMLDPFIVASLVLQNTTNFQPIIAALPNYMNPVAAVKKMQSIYAIYGKTVNFNMITGAAKNELEQLSDHIGHSERYRRLEEYIEVVKLLLRSEEPVNFSGSYYNYNRLNLGPALPKRYWPEIYIAGSSEASINVGQKLADVLITHPGPVQYYKEHYVDKISNPVIKKGIEIGIITRETSVEAWDVANCLYPQNFIGVLHTKMKLMSQSSWLRQMAELGVASETHDGVFWLGAFISGLAHNPILVGSYDEVAAYMREYLKLGVNVIILTDLRSPFEFEHVDQVLKQVR
ncbi:LLM class flavin-dependent oxidoreductase [Paenibacillus tyrfis]|uniref:LLM class flavin-dependent oxidoreductase n=1 Tax=Paenibacillus tyrfis TaxID=1501230 RepID=UPI000690C7C2|nr:LLM class flavin-dependent oxidoreductase [Paenibacillus tyrfis]